MMIMIVNDDDNNNNSFSQATFSWEAVLLT